MALTMTRTRTQTTLTRLAEQLACVNGELEALRSGHAETSGVAEGTRARRETLERQREALVLTLSQFDPSLEVSAVGCSMLRRARTAGRSAGD